jgi:hypothetical protein
MHAKLNRSDDEDFGLIHLFNQDEAQRRGTVVDNNNEADQQDIELSEEKKRALYRIFDNFIQNDIWVPQNTDETLQFLDE